MITARAWLSELQGELRVDPDPGAAGYRAWLQLDVWFDETGLMGDLSPNVLLDHGDGTAVLYHPLRGYCACVKREERTAPSELAMLTGEVCDGA